MRIRSVGISQDGSNGAGTANFPLIEHVDFAVPADRLHGGRVNQILLAFNPNRALELEDLAHPFGLTRFPVGSQDWKPMLSRQLAQLSKRPLTRRRRVLVGK